MAAILVGLPNFSPTPQFGGPLFGLPTVGSTIFFSFPSSQLWVEHLEGAEAGDPRGDGAGEGVELEVEAREVLEREELGWEGAREVVGAEAEQLQRVEAGERAGRDGAREAEAREVQRDDAGAVGAAGDPGPAVPAGGAGARGRRAS